MQYDESLTEYTVAQVEAESNSCAKWYFGKNGDLLNNFDIAKLFPSPIYYEYGLFLSYRYRKDLRLLVCCT